LKYSLEGLHRFNKNKIKNKDIQKFYILKNKDDKIPVYSALKENAF